MATNDPVEQRMRLLNRLYHRKSRGMPLRLSDQEVRLMWDVIETLQLNIDLLLNRPRWWRFWKKRRWQKAWKNAVY